MSLIKLAAACGLAMLSAVSGASAQAEPTLPLPNAAELVFTPIPPCRAFVTGTAMPANSERIFTVSGPSSAFAAQGGPSAGCGVPASATAVAMSFTSFGSAGAGYLRVTAYNDPVISNTQVLSFNNNATVTAGAITSVKEGKFIIRSFSGSTKLLGDVTGYFAPAITAKVNSDGSVLSVSSRITSTYIENGHRFFVVDRDIENCTPSVQINSAFDRNADILLVSNTIRVRIFAQNSAGNAIGTPAAYWFIVHC